MESLYIYFGLPAVIAVAFGLLIRALYRCRASTGVLSAENEHLQRELEQKQMTVREVRDEAERQSTLIRSLEQQVQQRSREMDLLRILLLRQDEEIRLLQRDTKGLQPTPAGSGELGMALGHSTSSASAMEDRMRRDQGQEGFKSAVLPEEQRELLSSDKPLSRPGETRAGQGIVGRSWKESLDGLLGVLDDMDREAQQ